MPRRKRGRPHNNQRKYNLAPRENLNSFLLQNAAPAPSAPLPSIGAAIAVEAEVPLDVTEAASMVVEVVATPAAVDAAPTRTVAEEEAA